MGIQLYSGGGASDFTLLPDRLSNEQCRVFRDSAARLLAGRSKSRAAEIIRVVAFSLVEGTNHFGADFYVLHAIVPLEQYEQLRPSQEDPQEGEAFCHIAEVLSELGASIRFIAVDLVLESPA